MACKQISLVVVAALALGVTGCGDHAAPGRPSQQRTQVVHVTADPSGSYDFIPSSLGARPGRVTIELYNPSSSFAKHGIAIEGHGVRAASPPAPRGGVSYVTVSLQQGRYRLYSPVDAQAQKGMTGTLVVR